MNSRNSWVRHLLNQNINSQRKWWNADIKTFKHLQFMLIIYYIHKEIFNHFSFEWIIQEWLQTTDHRREKQRCFTHHMMINTLLNIIINTRLKLLLKLNIITYEAYNQFTMIDLISYSKKIQFMTCKCKIWINLH